MAEQVELAPKSSEEIKAQLESKGWTAQLLSQRWGMTRRRVDQIVVDADRPRYYDDAIRALPKVPTKVLELVPHTPAEIKQALASKGWTPVLLSQRWGMTRRRVDQIVVDADRPRYYDDAILGLPRLSK